LVWIRRKLRSALSEIAVQELQERIARGRVGVGESSADEKEVGATDPLRASQSRNMLFSSDSEEETKSSEPLHPAALETSELADSKHPAQEKAPLKKAARKAAAKTEGKSPAAKPHAPDVESAAQPKSPRRPTKAAAHVDAKSVEAVEEKPASVSATAPEVAGTKRKAVDLPLPVEPTAAVPFKATLPPVRATKNETKKRARPRLSRLPDISFLPPRIQDICKRVSAYITRTVLLSLCTPSYYALPF
jgi:hypothetical protein